MAMWAVWFVQCRNDDYDAVILSLSPFHNQDTRICIVRLGLPDLQEAGLS